MKSFKLDDFVMPSAMCVGGIDYTALSFTFFMKKLSCLKLIVATISRELVFNR